MVLFELIPKDFTKPNVSFLSPDLNSVHAFWKLKYVFERSPGEADS